MGPFFSGGPISIRVQSILYRTLPRGVARSIEALARAVEVARDRGVVLTVEVAYGDGSDEPALVDDALSDLRQSAAGALTISYSFFGKNLGCVGDSKCVLGC